MPDTPFSTIEPWSQPQRAPEDGRLRQLSAEVRRLRAQLDAIRARIQEPDASSARTTRR